MRAWQSGGSEQLTSIRVNQPHNHQLVGLGGGRDRRLGLAVPAVEDAGAQGRVGHPRHHAGVEALDCGVMELAGHPRGHAGDLGGCGCGGVGPVWFQEDFEQRGS